MHSILVSSCLLGEPVRYDGGASRCDGAILQRWIREGRVVPVCPELAGGLPVPRPPAEITRGGGPEVLAGIARVIERSGRDVTAPYVLGADHTLEMAAAMGIRLAVLKEGSPSCGSGLIHDGSFTGAKRPGLGVTAARLRQAGIRVFCEAQLAEADCVLGQLERGVSG